jgi:hypothetical protein
MRIRVIGQAGEPIFPFSSGGPWVKFKDNLINNKDVLVTQKFAQKIDVLICHGYSKSAISEANKSKVPKNKMILVLWEPPIIHPKLHSDEYLSNFGYIYAPSKEWARKYNAIYFNWPVADIKSKFKITNFKNRQNGALIIQGNKINFHKGENYSLRRTVLFKSLKLKYPIMLYGSEWEKLPTRQMFKAFVNFLLNVKQGISWRAVKYATAKYPYYKGISKNKFLTLEKYKISIVIENHNSYVSEKIFDSLNSNCITIYVGPNLAEYGLNKNIAIQSGPNSKSILNSLERIMELSDREVLKIHKTQRYYLKKVIKNWNNEIVLKNLAKDIRNKIKK